MYKSKRNLGKKPIKLMRDYRGLSGTTPPPLKKGGCFRCVVSNFLFTDRGPHKRYGGPQRASCNKLQHFMFNFEQKMSWSH